eukprot:scaffold1911_cov114-Skeletonema_dohrnii-CCMP3373.AAC.2
MKNTRRTSSHKQEDMSETLFTVTKTPNRSTTPATKPLRPLTAYHIFFQIEREFIIQATAGPNVNDDESEKKLLRNVPNRYAATKLRPDWYLGPGKRQKKRKHRKTHGKIGFFELSRLISTRWAALEQTHPDVKKFVQGIADKEVDEYRDKEEMRQWKLAENGKSSSDHTAKKTTKKPVTKAPKKRKSASKSKAVAAKMISPPSSSNVSLDVEDISFPTTSISDDEGEDKVDYSISSISCNGHHIPSLTIKGEDLASLDPLLLFDGDLSPPQKRLRCCVSPPAFSWH